MKNLILTAVTLCALVAAGVGSTIAGLSDSEVSMGNFFETGALDLRVSDAGHQEYDDPDLPPLIQAGSVYPESARSFAFDIHSVSEPSGKIANAYIRFNDLRQTEAESAKHLDGRPDPENTAEYGGYLAGMEIPGLAGGAAGLIDYIQVAVYFDADGDGETELILGNPDWGETGTVYLQKLAEEWLSLGMVPACEVRDGVIFLHVSDIPESVWGEDIFPEDIPFSHWPTNALMLDRLTFKLEFALTQEPISDSFAPDVNPHVSLSADPPRVKCLWETPDNADPFHELDGAQMLPSGIYQVSREVRVWALVQPPAGVPVSRVLADLYFPIGPPENGRFKERLELSLVNNAEAVLRFDEAASAGLFIFAPGADSVASRNDLIAGRAFVYLGKASLGYADPAGNYSVRVWAETVSGSSLPLANVFTYAPLTSLEFDFDSITYENIVEGTKTSVTGDDDFSSRNVPTLRNVGNTCTRLVVWQDDMGFGKTGREWNVSFDVGVGDRASRHDLTPLENVFLPEVIPPGETRLLDFSVFVRRASPGIYTGQMRLGSIYTPFSP